jgi:hypothetical protein
MAETDHAKIRSIAEQLSGRTLPGLSDSTLIDIIEANVRQNSRESSGNTTIQDEDDVLQIDTSTGSATVTLPETAREGREITIIDNSGNSSVNNITVTATNTTIFDLPDVTIDTDFAVYTFQFFNGRWVIVEAFEGGASDLLSGVSL